jgi:hypothetical protein
VPRALSRSPESARERGRARGRCQCLIKDALTRIYSVAKRQQKLLASISMRLRVQPSHTSAYVSSIRQHTNISVRVRVRAALP